MLKQTSLAFLVVLGAVAAHAAAPAKDYPIQPVPFTAVRVQDSFWTPRMETNRLTTVWYDFQKCEETGRIDNFAKAGKLMPGAFRGTPFDDSDVFKVIEGASCTLALQPDPKLEANRIGQRSYAIPTPQVIRTRFASQPCARGPDCPARDCRAA